MYDYRPDKSDYASNRSGQTNNNFNYEVFSEEEYHEAEKFVRAKYRFYGNLISFLVVSVLQLIVYLLTSLAHGEFYYPWLIWPISIWAIVLLSHFIKVFVIKDNATTRRKLIEAEMRKMGMSFHSQSYSQSSEK